jgi:hypothetical protein
MKEHENRIRVVPALEHIEAETVRVDIPLANRHGGAANDGRQSVVVQSADRSVSVTRVWVIHVVTRRA